MDLVDSMNMRAKSTISHVTIIHIPIFLQCIPPVPHLEASQGECEGLVMMIPNGKPIRLRVSLGHSGTEKIHPVLNHAVHHTYQVQIPTHVDDYHNSTLVVVITTGHRLKPGVESDGI